MIHVWRWSMHFWGIVHYLVFTCGHKFPLILCSSILHFEGNMIGPLQFFQIPRYSDPIARFEHAWYRWRTESVAIYKRVLTSRNSYQNCVLGFINWRVKRVAEMCLQTGFSARAEHPCKRGVLPMSLDTALSLMVPCKRGSIPFLW